MAKQACIFCNIIEGKEKAWKIYEDEQVLVILDAFPVTEGHMLILPKKHVEDLLDLSDEEIAHIFKVAKKVAKAAKKALNAEFVNIITAPSMIKHAHVHVIPRYDYDLMGLVPDMDNKKKLSDEEMEIIQRKIKGALNESST